MLRLLGARLALRVMERPLVKRHDPHPGRLDELLTELDRLREDDFLFGGEEGDLADLLEVHPNRVIDPDHVGGDRLEILGGGFLDFRRVEFGGSFESTASPSAPMTSTAISPSVGASAPLSSMPSSSSSSTFGRTTLDARSP